MYDCPIKTFLEAESGKIQETYDNHIIMAVKKVGIEVNKDELIKAIRGDRERYETAYQKGWNDCERHYRGILSKIVDIAIETEGTVTQNENIVSVTRCKDCKRHEKSGDCDYGKQPDDWFCADGIPKDCASEGT